MGALITTSQQHVGYLYKQKEKEREEEEQREGAEALS